MSQDYGATGAGGSSGDSGKVDTAKQEAAGVKDAAAGAAGDVLETTKDAAASVAAEAKVQVQDLYHQTRDELTEQASKQQQRIADGLRTVGDDLGSMARNSESGGVAADLVDKVSARISGAASWLNDRDPSSVLAETRAFARRRPGAFILGAAVAGIVVGRLTRALASSAHDSAGSSGSSGSRPQLASSGSGSTLADRTPTESQPVYDALRSDRDTTIADAGGAPAAWNPEAAASGETGFADQGIFEEGTDERRDTF